MLRLLSILTLSLFFVACAPEAEPEPEVAELEPEWVTLFDGTSLDTWRGYQREDVPPTWTIEDGTLSLAPGEDGGDLITREPYEDFELELEYNISPEGNSGIIYRATENYDAPWHTGPEFQVLDDEGYPGDLQPAQYTGSNYDLNAPLADVDLPPGEWNQVRIVVNDKHVEHWLNGTKVADYELESDEWTDLVNASKFVEYPDFGRNRGGHIVLQDHGNPVQYRNIRIRELSSD